MGTQPHQPGRLNIVNRNKYKTFQNSPIIPFKTDRRLKAVKLERICHDEVYADLKAKGLQIDITNPEILVNGKRPIDGIFSPLFGADTTQDIPIYSCDCRKLTGGTNLGRICPECGTECRSIEANLTLCGYIDIAPYHILTYHGVNAFTKLLGKDEFNEIITSVKKINQRGKTIKDGKRTLMSLYDDFEEEYAPYIDIEKKYLFTSKIPVYSARLRPLIMTSRVRMTILDVNKCYENIVVSRGVLISAPVFRLDREVEIQKTLNEIQQRFIEICGIVEGQINEKSGVFRKALAAARLDYSGRLVIALNTTLMPHEIDIPYSTMMVICEEEIVNYLSRLEGISRKKAIDLVHANAMHYDERFAKIINQILKTGHGVWALINRNPTISESSILYVRIRKIHRDPDDYTMHLAPDILTLLAADFDGDQLTIYIPKDNEFHKYFLTMCPTYTFIDRANGKYNEAMSFKREYVALIACGWEDDKLYDRYLTTPNEENYNLLVDHGIIGEDTEYSKEKQAELLKFMAENIDKKHPFRQRYVDNYWYDTEGELFSKR